MTAPPGYVLVWNDEFDYPATSDPLSNAEFANKWFLSSSVCDYDLIPANVTLDGNNVVFTCSNSTDGGGITSVCTNNGNTKPNSLLFKYGYLEVRSKLGDTNEKRGLVSDIWLNGNDTWPPEIELLYYNSSLYPGGWWGTDFSNINFPIYMYTDYIRLYSSGCISPTCTFNIG